ncbi:phosphoadenosine phosphosulfate reductase domain-containing protein [Thermomonospora cellulosilytica]|uniref:Putative phosphoadenosine phosphosulfate sulfurtransferase n=1 Tax=Thermomonospora cellulosilytica TaxID=1411118 RepID=A0A7W3RAR1_9ACTN|nr:phosphoadenosine phosphosulfate reductase family protein [Thermomonospora cellulosilytica]MBA9005969.1 putative phosphoadenosine phosphosulfate sulfurtransferase [Thermomonospora cellulosilytica]
MTDAALPDGWVPEGTPIDRHDDAYELKATLPRVAAGSDVYTLACERTAYVMDTHDRVFVAFSGGKDSTAVLNVALEVAHSDPRFERHLPLRVVHFDEEAIPQETEEYVRRIAQRPDVALEWYCLPVQHRNACSRRYPYWWPWAPEDQERWCRPLPPEALTTLPGFPLWPPEERLTIPNTNGLLAPPPHTTAMLMGIRAQESRIRAMAVRRRAVDNYIVKYDVAAQGRQAAAVDHGNLWKAYPIYDWLTADVWAAVRVRGWDYNRAYDLMEMAGVGVSGQRCSPAFGEEPLQKIHVYAECFPDVWARMAERVPGIGAAYRYARTELYGFNSRPNKPAGMAWRDFILHFLSKHDPKVQPTIAERIRDAIARHYRKTTQPILPTAPHPVTGLSWRFLLTLAMRGDFKKRRQERNQLIDDDEVTYWHRYATELAQVLADGVTPAELGHPRPLPADPYALIPPHLRQEAP